MKCDLRRSSCLLPRQCPQRAGGQRPTSGSTPNCWGDIAYFLKGALGGTLEHSPYTRNTGRKIHKEEREITFRDTAGKSEMLSGM